MSDANDTTELTPPGSADETAEGAVPEGGDAASATGEPAAAPAENADSADAPGPRAPRARRPTMPPAELRAALEAILFASGEPVKREDLYEAFDEEGAEAVDAELAAIEASFKEREGGFLLEKAAGGYRFATRAELDPHLRKFFARKNEGRLSMAALETLAIIAYRQPMTLPEINDIRSVNSTGVIRTLLDRKMIKIAGRKNVVGSPFLYKTTKEFLIHFGLESIQDLPRLEEFTEILGENLAEELLTAATAEEDILALEPGEAGADEDEERTSLEAEEEALRLDGSLNDLVAGDEEAIDDTAAGEADVSDAEGADSAQDALESDASERD
ncbi:MAG TPA: SMC-Scp complex subunit ScpB [Thermoanaerobaculia bacterium]